MVNFNDPQSVWLWVQRSLPGGVVGALILLIVGWLIARALEWAVTAALRRTGVDRRLATAGANGTAVTAVPTDTPRLIGRIVFWLVMVFVLIAVFDALGLTLVTMPLTGLLTGIFDFLPHLFAAAIILVFGWLLARIAGQLVTGILAATGIDQFARRHGFGDALGSQQLSSILGTIVYLLILLPVITAALDALQLEALTRPLSNMINQVLAALPNVVAAVVLVTLAYVIGRLLGDLVSNVLTSLGVNAWPERLGFPPPPTATGTPEALTVPRTPAQLAGTLIHAVVVWFALIQGMELLGFHQVALLLTDLLTLAGRILFGLLIFLVGLYLARLAAEAIRASGVGQPNLLALVAQAAILVLAGAMALLQMGLANEIVTLAFALFLGAIALAAALAFGLGGRNVAEHVLEDWVQAAQSGKAERQAAHLQDGSTRPPLPSRAAD